MEIGSEASATGEGSASVARLEFADYRPYTVGDDLRFLDWSLYGRMEKLFLRLFLEEEDLSVYLLIDNSRSMDSGNPTKLRYAKQVAAALGFIGLVNLDRVSIEAVGGGDAGRSPVYRGRPSLWRMLKFLDNIPVADSGDLNQSLRRFSRRATGQGSQLDRHRANLQPDRDAAHQGLCGNDW